MRGFATAEIDCCEPAVKRWTFSAVDCIVEGLGDSGGPRLSSVRGVGRGRISMAGNDAGLRPQRGIVDVLTLTCYHGLGETKRDGRAKTIRLCGEPHGDASVFLCKALISGDNSARRDVAREPPLARGEAIAF